MSPDADSKAIGALISRRLSPQMALDLLAPSPPY